VANAARVKTRLRLGSTILAPRVAERYAARTRWGRLLGWRDAGCPRRHADWRSEPGSSSASGVDVLAGPYRRFPHSRDAANRLTLVGVSRRNRSDLPPPCLAELAGYPTHGATVLCLACDRGVSFAWRMLIERHGERATWTAIGSCPLRGVQSSARAW